jgi:hypothetical protein
VNRDLSWLISPIVALIVLAASVFQTMGALGVTGAFGAGGSVPRPTVAPAYQALDRAIDQRDPHFTLEHLRDPFTFGRYDGDNDGDDPIILTPRPRPVAVTPVPEARPVLTAIVSDHDPRALIRWKEREWTVREGGLFDEFQVLNITRDQVTLRRGDQTLVLQRKNPGETP